MGDAALASLERNVREFGAAVDKIVAAKKVPSSPVKMPGQTPLVMQLLGSDTVDREGRCPGAFMPRRTFLMASTLT